MARLSRLVLAGHAHHVVHRSAPSVSLFADDADHQLFKAALRRSARENSVALHAYVLLPHEVQLLATPSDPLSLSRMMQALARFYVPGFNQRRHRTGALWQGRFRAAPVGGADELLLCMRYIEHVGGTGDDLLAGAPSASGYWTLGNTPFERERAYGRLLSEALGPAELAALENSTLKGWAFGSGEFIASLSAETPRRLAAKPRGRPRRSE
jgi:putative transposase